MDASNIGILHYNEAQQTLEHAYIKDPVDQDYDIEIPVRCTS